MTARLACLLLLLLVACSPAPPPVEAGRAGRGTALPPPDLAAPPIR